MKPENILLDRLSGQAKLTDFGVARADTDARLTTDGSLIGTPLFMAPEQALGQTVGPLADLFSVGGVLDTAATGRPPFDAPTVFQVLKLVCECEPVPPRELRPDLPAWFDSLILKLLAKRQQVRYQSADEVLAVLRNPPAAPQSVSKKGW